MTHGCRKRVVVGMSGGVDSSVAAALLLAQGFDVTGVSINMFSCHAEGTRSCCSARDRMDARAVCERLGIPYLSVDRREGFRSSVMDPFVADYVAGRTPSPCVLCNSLVKFPAILEEAGRLGAELIATGHYARVREDSGRFRLLCALDRKKDQSYFLFGLGQDMLGRLNFPLGETDKARVRAAARNLGFANAGKKESQEVCFVPDDDYAAFVEVRARDDIRGAGDFVDTAGRRVGSHQGIHRYTIGQRRGLGFGTGQRQYVTAIDAAQNVVVLGAKTDLDRREISVRSLSWTHQDNAVDRDAIVKVRSAHQGARARIRMQGKECCRVIFEEPVSAPAPGQAAVFYDGDEVLGGGWIE